MKLDPRVEVVDWPWYVTAGKVGYATEAAVLWREAGDMPADDALGEWPEVYDMVPEGGVTAGVPVEGVDATSGEATWGPETAA